MKRGRIVCSLLGAFIVLGSLRGFSRINNPIDHAMLYTGLICGFVLMIVAIVMED